jgi:hypothetical protein
MSHREDWDVPGLLSLCFTVRNGIDMPFRDVLPHGDDARLQFHRVSLQASERRDLSSTYCGFVVWEALFFVLQG